MFRLSHPFWFDDPINNCWKQAARSVIMGTSLPGGQQDTDIFLPPTYLPDVCLRSFHS